MCRYVMGEDLCPVSGGGGVGRGINLVGNDRNKTSKNVQLNDG